MTVTVTLVVYCISSQIKVFILTKQAELKFDTVFLNREWDLFFKDFNQRIENAIKWTVTILLRKLAMLIAHYWTFHFIAGRTTWTLLQSRLVNCTLYPFFYLSMTFTTKCLCSLRMDLKRIRKLGDLNFFKIFHSIWWTSSDGKRHMLMILPMPLNAWYVR